LFQYDSKDKILEERERLEFYGYPADYLETYRAALEKVTLADLAAVAKKYVHPDKLASAGGRQRAGDQAGTRRAEAGNRADGRHHDTAAEAARCRWRKVTAAAIAAR